MNAKECSGILCCVNAMIYKVQRQDVQCCKAGQRMQRREIGAMYETNACRVTLMHCILSPYIVMQCDIISHNTMQFNTRLCNAGSCSAQVVPCNEMYVVQANLI